VSRPAPRRWLTLTVALALVGASVSAVHWPVLESQALSLDDPVFVTYNPLVTHPGWASTGRFFREVLHPSTVAGYYLPLTMTSLMLDYAMGGRPDDLRVFHRTNLALHVLNTLLILLILYRLFGAVIPAVIAALMFGLHPLTVEPVAWIGERKTLLATCFALACLLAYVESCRRGRAAWRAASVALYLLALLSKPTVMMLPALLVLLDWWPLNRLSKRALLEKWPFFAVSLVLGTITFVSHQLTAGFMPASQADALPSPLRVCYLIAFYLGKIVGPENLSCIYPSPPSSWSSPAVLASLVAILGSTLLLVFASRRARGPLAGWLFFVIALAPTLGLIRYSWVSASDKYLYFPALGVLMVLTSALAAAWNSPRLGVAAKVATLLLVVPIVGAEARGVRGTLGHWSDSMTLFRQMERVAPDSPVVHAQLGVLLERASRREEALVHLRRALELAPEFPVAYFNLGVVLARQGQLEESVRLFRIADEMTPNTALTIYNIALSLRLMGKLDEAEAQYRRALRVKPDYVDALNELGGLLIHRGRPAEAVTELRKAVTLAPADAALQHRLSVALLIRGGDPSEAVDHLREAIRHQPDWPEPYNTLAWLRATSPDPAFRDTTEALRLGTRAAELTGGRDARVLDTLAAAQAAAGRFAEAVRTERDAIAIVTRSPADTLARGMRERMQMYGRGRAYREPASAGVTPAS
jgi:Flp pilus assembly protein TadD